MHAEIARAVRDIVSTNHGLALSTVCLLRTRSIPKTTSGKIARSWCRRGFLEKTLQVIYRMDSDAAAESGKVGADNNVEELGEGAAVGAKKTGAGGGTMGYSKVHNEETGVRDVPPVQVTGIATRTAEEVRALPIEEVQGQLEHLLVQVAAQGPSPLTPPLDAKTAVSQMGLDSMTLVQFKGVLEKKLVPTLCHRLLLTGSTLLFIFLPPGSTVISPMTSCSRPWPRWSSWRCLCTRAG